MFTFIFKIGNHYVIGSYFFSTVYITKNIDSVWNNHLRLWKLSLCLFLFLYWEEAKKVQTSPYNSATHLILKTPGPPFWTFCKKRASLDTTESKDTIKHWFLEI